MTLPGAPLPYGRLYNLSEPETKALKAYIDDSLKKWFIRPSTFPIGAGIFFVGKKDGGLRPCVDYRSLNDITKKNRYPLPLIPDLLDRVKDAQFFTKFVRGTNGKRPFVQDSDIEYLVMPFGLCNTPATFQHFVNDMLRDLLDSYVVVYLDDILVFSQNLPQHEQHVKSLLSYSTLV